MDKVPTSTIGILSQIIPDNYSHAEINSLFLYAGAPEAVPDGNKQVKVQEWLRKVDLQHEQPIAVLGSILEDFMEREIAQRNRPWSTQPNEMEIKLEADKQKIRETLAKDGLAYARGGVIVKAGTSSTLSLDESVKKHGLKTVDIEIRRALAKIEEDPQAAAQYAGNVLEATLKAYLDSKSVSYSNSDELRDIWKLASHEIGLRPKEWDDKDLKKIASGLNSVLDGIMYFRNKKSGAHGRSEEQSQNINIKPRHARLAIHAAHTVAAYVLELMD